MESRELHQGGAEGSWPEVWKAAVKAQIPGMAFFPARVHTSGTPCGSISFYVPLRPRAGRTEGCPSITKRKIGGGSAASGEHSLTFLCCLSNEAIQAIPGFVLMC